MDLKKRLDCLIRKDKSTNPKYIIDVIKSDFFYLINNYFEVPFENIDINVELIEDNYQIQISCLGERIKIMKTLPE